MSRYTPPKSVVTKGFLKQKQNDFFKIIIRHEKKQYASFSFLTFWITSNLILKILNYYHYIRRKSILLKVHFTTRGLGTKDTSVTQVKHERHNCYTSNTSATGAQREQQECNTSEKRVGHGWHKFDTRATQRKFNFVNGRLW